MAWIELHQSAPTHRKTLALADTLGIQPAHALGHLTCLWLWSLDNAPDGRLDVPATTIARAAQWTKNAKTFVAALAQAGFLEPDEEDGSQVIHDWYDYAGKLVDRRTTERERSRVRRTTTKQPPDDHRPTGGQPPVVGETANGTVPNRTVPNHVANATSPVAPRAKVPKSARRVEVTEAEIEALVGDFAPRMDGAENVRLVIDAALNNTARFRAINEKRYLQLWLGREIKWAAERRQSRPPPVLLRTATAAGAAGAAADPELDAFRAFMDAG